MTTVLYGVQELRLRGWTDAMIEGKLGTPALVRPTKTQSSARFWRRETVLKIEATSNSFRDHREQLRTARKKRRTVRNRRHKETASAAAERHAATFGMTAAQLRDL